MKFLAQIILFAAFAVSSTLAADFTGKVLDPDGKPVKNASVYLFDLSHEFEVPTTRRDAPTTQTDDAGVYHLASPDSKSANLAATADGLGFGHNGTNTASPNRDIRLAHWTYVTLTFLSPDNTPAANVAVHVLSLSRMGTSTVPGDAFFFPPPFRSHWSATTDAHGQCTFSGLPQGETLGIAVDDERYIQPTVGIELANAPKTQADPIQLSLGSSISGTVTDSAKGKPVGGITVQAFSGPAQLGRALTAADGSYSISQLQPATYTLELVLNAQQQQSCTAKAIPGIVATAGKTQSGVDLSLIPGVILSGTVIAADDGKPLAGVPIGIFGPAHPRQGGQVQFVTTDSTGTFSARVPPGKQFVFIQSSTPADGYSRPSPDNKTITIADGATGSVEFRLPRVLMSPIVGKVVDPDGNPVVGASVYVSSDMAPMFNRVAVATNADGIFQSLPMQRVGKIQIRAKFKNMGTPKPVLITRGATDIVIHLEKDALGSISGRVTDPQGNPLAGTEIVLITRTTRFSNGDAASKTDAQGNFKIESLWPDPTYSVEAVRDGYGQNQTAQLHIQPGQDLHAPDLLMYKRDATIAGVYLDADGKPMARKRIFVRGPKSGNQNLTTDANGKFTGPAVSGDALTIFYNIDTASPYRRQTAHGGDQDITLGSSPPHVVVAQTPATDTPAAALPIAVTVFDPVAAATWNGWLFAIVTLTVCTSITVVASAIAALFKRRPA